MREASFSLPLLMNWWALAEEALVGLLMKGDCVYVCVCVGGGIFMMVNLAWRWNLFQCMYCHISLKTGT